MRIRALALLLALSAPAQAAERVKEIMLVASAEALAQIEEQMGTLGERLCGRDSKGFNNALLSRRVFFSGVVETIEKDFQALAAGDPGAGTGPEYTRRLFDVGWLRSPFARFELAGVVNRLDLSDASSCGEIRFVYRLAYDAEVQKQRADSRLPMAVNVAYKVLGAGGGKDCRSAARRWLAPASASGRSLGAWLVSKEGPLAPALMAPERLKSVQVTLQAMRWIPKIRGEMGGHVEYILREFRPDPSGKHLEAVPLENTPDAARLRRDPALRAKLLAWIVDPANLERIDAGRASLPEEFLAQRALAAYPHGLLRRANRPFRQLFGPEDFKELKLSKRRNTRSPEALLRRLDSFSCMGCHQARSAAVFHLPGEDPPGTPAGNALALAVSPHVIRDLPRRRESLRAMASGKSLAEDLPWPERAGLKDDGYGAHCGLGDPSFSSWTCARGLACSRYLASEEDLHVGQCFPRRPLIGDPCELGRISLSPNPRRDSVAAPTRLECGENRVCEPNSTGYPGGMCSSRCVHLKPGDGVCGGVEVLEDFAQCLERKAPMSSCLEDYLRPAGLRACGANEPCRDDYVCAKMPAGPSACVPPYFLPQLRVDGHPTGLP